MPDNRLINYIKANLANGAHEEQIRKALAEVGWADDLVNDAFEFINKPKEEEIIILQEEPIKESRSAKMMWTLLILLVVALVTSVILIVVFGDKAKKVSNAQEIDNLTAEEKAADLAIEWQDGEEWESTIEELYNKDEEELAAEEAMSRMKSRYTGEDGDFIVINKLSKIVYFAYRGKVGRCFFAEDYTANIMKELQEDFSATLEKLKSSPSCDGDIWEDAVIKHIGRQVFMGLNFNFEELDLSTLPSINLTVYQKDGLTLNDYRGMSTCDSMDCFIEKAKNCETVSYLEEDKETFLTGPFMPQAVYHEIIRQEEDGRCVYRNAVVDSHFYIHPLMLPELLGTEYDKSLSEDEIIKKVELMMNENLSAMSVGSYCKYPVETLLKVLEDEKNGAFSSSNYTIDLCRSLNSDGSIMTPAEMGYGEQKQINELDEETFEIKTSYVDWEVWE